MLQCSSSLSSSVIVSWGGGHSKYVFLCALVFTLHSGAVSIEFRVVTLLMDISNDL